MAISPEQDPKSTEVKKQKKWYAKKRFIIPGFIIAAFVSVGVLGNSNPNVTSNTTSVTPAVAQQQTTQNSSDTSSVSVSTTKAPELKASALQVTSNDPLSSSSNNDLSNSNYYTSVNGDSVHSPAYDEDNQVPTGATAECSDGTYSFSENHRGTCSHHGGVMQWLN